MLLAALIGAMVVSRKEVKASERARPAALPRAQRDPLLLGLYCVLTRRNAIGILMGVELILNSANINYVAFARYGARRLRRPDVRDLRHHAGRGRGRDRPRDRARHLPDTSRPSTSSATDPLRAMSGASDRRSPLATCADPAAAAARRDRQRARRRDDSSAGSARARSARSPARRCGGVRSCSRSACFVQLAGLRAGAAPPARRPLPLDRRRHPAASTSPSPPTRCPP